MITGSTGRWRAYRASLLYPMHMAHWTLFHIVAIFGLILANGFFVAAEFALVSLRATRVEQL